MKEFMKVLMNKVEKLEQELEHYNNYIGDKNARLIYQSLRSQTTDKRARKTGKGIEKAGCKLHGKSKSERNGGGGCII